jgi:hypothetical protein
MVSNNMVSKVTKISHADDKNNSNGNLNSYESKGDSKRKIWK